MNIQTPTTGSIGAAFEVARLFSPEKFNDAFDRMIAKIDFESEAESIQHENVEVTKQAFISFLKEMNWTVADWCFEDLLTEKSGVHEYRADGKTPNWYHEFRECLYYLSLVRGGLIKEDDIKKFGGFHAGIGMILRHDSWEDLGTDKMRMYSLLEKRIHDLTDEGEIFEFRQIAATIVEGVDLLTRQVPARDEYGRLDIKPNGKLNKVQRFGGDLNTYISHVVSNPNTALAKFIDAIEGMATRIGKNADGADMFTLDKNISYTNERRFLFGLRATDEEASDKFPNIKSAIKGLDSMLGIVLVCQETENEYRAHKNLDPVNGKAIRIRNYLYHAEKVFKYIPTAFHPVSMFLERMEIVAAKNIRARALLDCVFYPSLTKQFDIAPRTPNTPKPSVA